MGAPAQMNLAQWILTEELGDGNTLSTLSETAERTCEKLSTVLIELVSPVGSQALFARALHLIRPEFPFLGTVRAGISPALCLEGLSESLQGVEIAEARRAVEALLVSLIGLLVTFLGEGLTFRLLAGAWPEAPSADTDSKRREA